MDGTQAEAKIEQLSEELVFAEPGDPKAMADLHTGFEELSRLSEEASLTEVQAAAKAIGQVIERIVLGEEEDPDASVEMIGRALSAVQSIVRDGRSAEDVDFPEELGLATGRSEEGAVDVARAGTRPAIPAHIDDAIFSEFLDRQGSVLDEMEGLVLGLEQESDEEKLGELRRLLHTLKGESALLGLGQIEHLCHVTEDVISDGWPSGTADALLEVKDWLGKTFGAYGGQGELPGPVEDLLSRLQAGEDAAAPTEAQDGSDAVVEEPEAEAPSTPSAQPLEGDASLLGEFVAEAREHLASADEHLLTVESQPRDEDALNAVFRAFHTIKGVAGFLALDEVQEVSHEAESLLDKARKGDLLLAGTAIDVTFETVDALKRLVVNVSEALSTGGLLGSDPSVPRLLARIKAAASGEAAAPEPDEPAPAATPAPDDDRAGAAPPSVSVRQAVVKVREAVKVDADRLDRLVDTIGELVIAESMVSQAIGLQNDGSTDLGRHLGQLDKITRELQEMGMGLRMVPIRPTFQKMARLVRDLGKKSGKPVQFVMSGEDTELDKTVVDRIGDPLVHMIRNAVDHGLEPSGQDREQSGKPAAGRVELRAFQKGGNIYIEIEDDGRGLDRDAILKKARDKGLLEDGEPLSDREVWNLIFQPGFSTAKTVTDVSGRGVGMDVVRRNIEALRGAVEISSQRGKGSVFTIRLPLTLAIIDGMVVRVGQDRYIIPTLSIVRSIRPKAEDLSTVLEQGEMLQIHGRLIPVFRLATLFEAPNAQESIAQALVVVVEDEGRQAGLVVDELLGQQQIVIKSLGEMLRGIPGVSGGAIMPDGRVGLILDVSGLVRLANSDAGKENVAAA